MNNGLIPGMAPALPGASPFVRPQIPVVDFIGDSITINGGTKTRTGPVSFTSAAWMQWASMQAQGKFLVGRVDGLAGITTEMLYSRYLPRALNDPSPIKAGYCVVLIGTNDSGAGYLWRYTETMKKIVAALIANGVEPILCTLTPRSSNSRQPQSNWIRHYAQQNGLKCIDFAVDPTLTHADSGNWLAGLSDDNVHPNAVGAKAMGSVVYNAFNAWGILRNNPPFSAQNSDSFSLVSPTNALMVTDTNADGVPDGWSLTGSGATSSLAASPYGVGQEMTVTAAAAATTIETGSRPCTPGAFISFATRFQVTTAGTTPSVILRAYKHGTAYNYEFTATVDVPAGYVLAGMLEIPTGLASNVSYVSAAITPGDGTVVKVSQPTIYDLRAQGVWPL